MAGIEEILMLSSYFPYGILELPFWGYALVVFGLIQLMFLGITLYLHREQSHGGLVLHPALRHFFRFWLWFSSGTVTREWVAVHRRHHAFADQPGDPHSPVIFGLKKVVLEGYELLHRRSPRSGNSQALRPGYAR
jgi:stearoyl-CoA desaturase (delta-9 desaturase)